MDSLPRGTLMKLWDIINKIINVLFFLLLVLFVIQVILKITGHSPITEAILSTGISLNVGYLFKVHYFMGQTKEFIGNTKESFRLVKEDIREIKADIKELRTDMSKIKEKLNVY